jgi:hypothetical protein
MNRRITLTIAAAAGGLLATAFLPVSIAVADDVLRCNQKARKWLPR